MLSLDRPSYIANKVISLLEESIALSALHPGEEPDMAKLSEFLAKLHKFSDFLSTPELLFVVMRLIGIGYANLNAGNPGGLASVTNMVNHLLIARLVQIDKTGATADERWTNIDVQAYANAFDKSCTERQTLVVHKEKPDADATP